MIIASRYWRSWRNTGTIVDLLQPDWQAETHQKHDQAPHTLHGSQHGELKLKRCCWEKYRSFIQVREWREFEHLSELPCLEDLVFIGNPLEEEATVNGNYTQQVSKRLLLLKKLDGYPIIREEEGDGEDDNVEDDNSDDSDFDDLGGDLKPW